VLPTYFFIQSIRYLPLSILICLIPTMMLAQPMIPSKIDKPNTSQKKTSQSPVNKSAKLDLGKDFVDDTPDPRATRKRTKIASTSDQCYQASRLEERAKASFYNHKLNRARTQVEKAIKAQVQPVVAAWVLSMVYDEAEGQFPKALYWIRQAQTWLKQRCIVPHKSLRINQLHKDLLMQEFFLLGDMDKREDQLRVLAYYEKKYKIPHNALKIWPLVKLGRFKEARDFGLKEIQSDDAFVRSRAYNGLMAVECEARERKSSYDWGMKGHLDAKEQSCVIALNMGLASRQCFKFDEEERFNRLASHAQDKDCSSSPFIQSSASYLIRGAFQKSISALTQWRPSTASEWIRSHTRLKARRAELMYSLGVWNKALDEIHEVATYPDRSAGSDSASEEMLHLEAALLYWAILNANMTQAHEHDAIRGWSKLIQGIPSRMTLRFRRWKQSRQMIRYAAYQNLLTDLMRPYYSNVMPWYLNNIVYILGSGLIRATILEARQLEANDYPQHAWAYLDAIEAELAWYEGDESTALAKIKAALTGIPKAVRLLRYRLTALRWAAKSQQSGQWSFSEDLHVLLKEYPTIIRMLNLAIPVKIRIRQEGEYAQKVAEALARSPRVRLKENAKLSFEISQSKSSLSLCLMGAKNYRYACVQTLLNYEEEVKRLENRRKKLQGKAHAIEKVYVIEDDQKKELKPKEKEIEDRLVLEKDPAFRLIDLAHAEIFAPKIELTQKELDTLDGNIQQMSASDAVETLYR
jgi:hypothetical protein